ncbi:SulP family inorganic anion transporter [Roseibium sp. CAU 1637]|uniref:SulP family inorganic anion transporter n=1 Tax=Roseibium limicola TaxID=2816037 RepID=A0A939J6L8_9HYPH|nr:SulP family inorganic anion transporter [Roseibium limicola]MBO0345262.1 SulP family inorganic anion transporter [Roseibium limicola]
MRLPMLFHTLKTYDKSQFLADFQAGVTVAMVAIPLSLAIAIASGAPPATGLITAVVAGFLISAFGGSRVQIGGPTGAFIVVVFSVIMDHGYDGLVLATFMAGGILILAGLLRLGRFIALVPESVVEGVTCGIAVIIAASQLKDFFGFDAGTLPAEVLPKLAILWTARDSLSPATLAIGLLTMGLILVLKRLYPKFPGLLVAVSIGSGLVVLLQLPVDTIVSRFGALPDHLPWPQLPVITIARLIELLPSAMVIAFLAGLESLLSAMIADKMTGETHRPNAELLGQGIANVGSALVGGLPATGALARTATNVQAGAKTPVAGLIHAFTVLAVLMLAAPLAGYLAMPALAALLLLAAWNMCPPATVLHGLKAAWPERVLFLGTLVLTVLVDLTVSLGVGIVAGLALRAWRQRSATSAH